MSIDEKFAEDEDKKSCNELLNNYNSMKELLPSVQEVGLKDQAAERLEKWRIRFTSVNREKEHIRNAWKTVLRLESETNTSAADRLEQATRSLSNAKQKQGGERFAEEVIEDMENRLERIRAAALPRHRERSKPSWEGLYKTDQSPGGGSSGEHKIGAPPSPSKRPAWTQVEDEPSSVWTLVLLVIFAVSLLTILVCMILGVFHRASGYSPWTKPAITETHWYDPLKFWTWFSSDKPDGTEVKKPEKPKGKDKGKDKDKNEDKEKVSSSASSAPSTGESSTGESESEKKSSGKSWYHYLNPVTWFSSDEPDGPPDNPPGASADSPAPDSPDAKEAEPGAASTPAVEDRAPDPDDEKPALSDQPAASNQPDGETDPPTSEAGTEADSSDESVGDETEGAPDGDEGGAETGSSLAETAEGPVIEAPKNLNEKHRPGKPAGGDSKDRGSR